MATFATCLTLNAAQVFTSGDFYAPCNTGSKDCRFNLSLELDFDGDTVSGKIINMIGIKTCQWADVPLKGSINPANEVFWKSEINPVKGCGRLIFNGKKDGEKIYGNFPSFQGKQVDINLIPKK